MYMQRERDVYTYIVYVFIHIRMYGVYEALRNRLPYHAVHAQRPVLLEAGACDVPYSLLPKYMPRGQSCWRLGLDEVPYYYLTMPRGQTCWRLGLVTP